VTSVHRSEAVALGPEPDPFCATDCQPRAQTSEDAFTGGESELCLGRWSRLLLLSSASLPEITPWLGYLYCNLRDMRWGRHGAL